MSESTKFTPFFMNYGRHPRMPVELDCGKEPSVPSVKEYTEKIESTIIEAQKNLQFAQQRQKSYADQHRRAVSYQPGQKVFLSTKNLRHRFPGAAKLLPRYIGPFKIDKLVGVAAVKLDLPPQYNMHDTFHVSLVKPYKGSQGEVGGPGPEFVEFETLVKKVERILDHRPKKKPREFLVKWTDTDYTSWEPKSNLGQCADLLTKYWEYVSTVD